MGMKNRNEKQNQSIKSWKWTKILSFYSELHNTVSLLIYHGHEHEDSYLNLV
jgi:hypothetical protein